MHHKISEIQIGKESTGISSDYNTNPIFHNHHNNKNNNNQALLWPNDTKPHKRPQIQGNIKPAHKKDVDAVVSMPRSPTIKGSIQCPNAVILHNHHKSGYNTLHHRWFWHDRRIRARRGYNLVPPVVVVVAIPWFWWYMRGLAPDGFEAESEPEVAAAALVGLWFDFFAVVVFVTGVVVCIRIAFPGFAGPLLNASLAALKEKRRIAKAARVSEIIRAPVTWTIGSKAKVESDGKHSLPEGVRVYSNGDVYEGEFHKGKCSGSGVYHYCMSGRYEGDWIDGKYDGYGVETWAKGSRYRGQYRQGQRHGYGVYRFYTGDVYSGEWCNGQSHGYGMHTCEDGSKFVGEFKRGVKHGLGYYHFRNGDTYAGEYFADKMHGFGVYHFANGHYYEGAWHEGTKQGLGMYTFRNGETQSGNWHHGIIDVPSTQNSQPGSPVAVNHSKVLNAVQEARQAAERAYEVPRVDEKVNRAVSAANRSANAARVAAVKAVQKRTHGNTQHAEV